MKGVGMLLSPRALKSLNSIEKIQLKMMCTTFNDKPCISIVSSYSPTSISDKMNITIFSHENGHIDKDKK